MFPRYPGVPGVSTLGNLSELLLTPSDSRVSRTTTKLIPHCFASSKTPSPLHWMLECAVSSSELEELDPDQLDLLVGFRRLCSITGAFLLRVLVAQPLGLGIWQYKVMKVVGARTRLSESRPPFHLPWFSQYVQLFSTFTLVSSPHCHKSCFSGGQDKHPVGRLDPLEDVRFFRYRLGLEPRVRRWIRSIPSNGWVHLSPSW